MQDKVKLVKILTVSAVIFISLLITALVINLIKLAGLSSKEARLKAELASVEQTIAQNADTLEFMQSDDYVDQYAREYLNLIGKDEKPFTAK